MPEFAPRKAVQAPIFVEKKNMDKKVVGGDYIKQVRFDNLSLGFVKTQFIELHVKLAFGGRCKKTCARIFFLGMIL